METGKTRGPPRSVGAITAIGRTVAGGGNQAKIECCAAVSADCRDLRHRANPGESGPFLVGGGSRDLQESVAGGFASPATANKTTRCWRPKNVNVEDDSK